MKNYPKEDFLLEEVYKVNSEYSLIFRVYRQFPELALLYVPEKPCVVRVQTLRHGAVCDRQWMTDGAFVADDQASWYCKMTEILDWAKEDKFFQ